MLQKQPQKYTFHILQLFGRKKWIVRKQRKAKPILTEKVACDKPDHWLMTENNPSAVPARNFAARRRGLRQTKKQKSARISQKQETSQKLSC